MVQRGIFEKFIVKRTDGSDGSGGKHEGCRYFVLDLTHDKHALPALRAYAHDCSEERPNLARDLLAIADPDGCLAIAERQSVSYETSITNWHGFLTLEEDTLPNEGEGFLPLDRVHVVVTKIDKEPAE